MRFTISQQFDSKIASSGLPSYQSLLQNGGKNLHRGGKSRRESRKIGTRKRRARLKQAVIRGIILPVHVCDAAQEHTRENDDVRSEEHTSELQSLMRISYAVFCLKKKKTTKNTA